MRLTMTFTWKLKLIFRRTQGWNITLISWTLLISSQLKKLQAYNKKFFEILIFRAFKEIKRTLLQVFRRITAEIIILTALLGQWSASLCDCLQSMQHGLDMDKRTTYNIFLKTKTRNVSIHLEIICPFKICKSDISKSWLNIDSSNCCCIHFKLHMNLYRQATETNYKPLFGLCQIST